MFSDKVRRAEYNETELKETPAEIGKLVVETDFFVTRAARGEFIPKSSWTSPPDRKSMINQNRANLSLTKQCRLLKISRLSPYYTPVELNADHRD